MRRRGPGDLHGSEGWALPSQRVGADCSAPPWMPATGSPGGLVGAGTPAPEFVPLESPSQSLRNGPSSLFCVLPSDVRFPITRVLCHLIPKS